MEIIIRRATLCLFQHTSRQSHHSNHLKMGKIAVTPLTRKPNAKIAVTPQTRNPHARLVWGGLLVL